MITLSQLFQVQSVQHCLLLPSSAGNRDQCNFPKATQCGYSPRRHNRELNSHLVHGICFVLIFFMLGSRVLQEFLRDSERSSQLFPLILRSTLECFLSLCPPSPYGIPQLPSSYFLSDPSTTYSVLNTQVFQPHSLALSLLSLPHSFFRPALSLSPAQNTFIPLLQA